MALLAVVQCEQTLAGDVSRMMCKEETMRSFQWPIPLPAKPGKAECPMPATKILQEAWKLQKVSDSLVVLAGQDARIAEALTLLSGNVRDSAFCWRFWSH
jgi:hypothetical protein